MEKIYYVSARLNSELIMNGLHYIRIENSSTKNYMIEVIKRKDKFMSEYLLFQDDWFLEFCLWKATKDYIVNDLASKYKDYKDFKWVGEISSVVAMRIKILDII